MSESGFASLGPSLLARKGGAKPAMRPQVAPLVTDETEIREEHLEDLGWNDMGHDSELPDGGADIVPIHADIAADAYTANGFGTDGGPIVRRQQRRLEERVLADAAMTGPDDAEPEYDEDSDYAVSLLGGEDYAEEDYAEDGEEGEDHAIYSPLARRAASPQTVTPAAPAPTPRSPARPRVPAAQSGRRAAFTLRLDASRHLKLRLAATMQGVSAQALVTEALDRLLAEYDELDVIANHLKRH
jgi:hypothetical protein